MKTKILLFLAVLGMGLGFFACEKEGGEPTVEMLSQELKEKHKALNQFFDIANQKSDGKLLEFIVDHKDNLESAVQSPEFSKFINIKEVGVRTKAFMDAHQALAELTSEEKADQVLIDNLVQVKLKGNGNNIMEDPDRLTCVNALSNGMTILRIEYAACSALSGGFGSFTICTVLYLAGERLLYSDFYDCVESSY
jgi:hypothetical protein